MCFVRNLILRTSCEFYYDYVTETLFINIKYGNVRGTGIRGLMRGMATLPKVTRSY